MLLNCVKNLFVLSLIYCVFIVISTLTHNTSILTIVFNIIVHEPFFNIEKLS